jgi:CheY-like chemotaxis protein
VLVNLAVNARDAMPGGGVLTIDTATIEVDAAGAVARVGLLPGPHVRLRVSDSGVGIPEELLGRVFEPFFTTRPKGDGSGLGLATVYGVISQSGGHTEITSEQGVGTTVTCLLPASDAEPAQDSPPAPASGGRARVGGAVLVVEDEDAMRQVTRRILERNGYRVLTASGAAEALRLVGRREEEREPIDLLVTDVIMPGMRGRELANHIRALLPAVKVVYMSGHAHPVLTTQGRLDPGVVLLEKPFSEQILLAAVREALDAG